eukprot:414227_1
MNMHNESIIINKFDDNNVSRVGQYHKLNQIGKNNHRNGSAMDGFNAIYVSVVMCEIEKMTTTTKETINQFWNEKLLFIIPYAVIDEITSDATHTLVRDTQHVTGLTEKFNKDTALSELQNVSDNKTDSIYITKSSLIDSLHLNKFARKSSILSTSLIPVVSKKLHLDFNLFDDSGDCNVQLDSGTESYNIPIWHFAGGRNNSKTNNMSKVNKPKSYKPTNDDSDEEFNSDSEEEKINNSFGISKPISHVSDNNKHGGEGTFLGSAHVSINIDDPVALAKYHTNVKEKEIKIGKKSVNKNETQDTKS